MAKSFKKLLKENKITQSFSKKGCPYDNSVAESFFASLKKLTFGEECCWTTN